MMCACVRASCASDPSICKGGMVRESWFRVQSPVLDFAFSIVLPFLVERITLLP